MDHSLQCMPIIELSTLSLHRQHKNATCAFHRFIQIFITFESCSAGFNFRNLRANRLFRRAKWAKNQNYWRFGWKNSISAGNYVADHYIIISFCLPQHTAVRFVPLLVCVCVCRLSLFGALCPGGVFALPTAGAHSPCQLYAIAHCKKASSDLIEASISRKPIKRQTW